MKKSTLSFTAIAVFASFISVKGQITLTSADAPKSGDTYVLATDSTASSFTIGNAGASQTWNFSALAAQKTDNCTAMAPSATPYQSVYPNATVAVSHSNSLATYVYYTVSSSAESSPGSSVMKNSNTEFDVINPEDKILPFPATYKSHWSGAYRDVDKLAYSSIPGYDSIETVLYIVAYDSIDAWGTITTPLGTFNSLRDNHWETDYDTTYYHTTGGSWTDLGGFGASFNEYAYIWYANNTHQPLVLASTSSTGAISQVQWLKAEVVGINELENNDVARVYPNPAKTLLTMQFSSVQTGYAIVLDVTGKQMDKIDINNSKAELNTSAYANGLYLYQVFDKQGTVMCNGKFSVVK